MVDALIKMSACGEKLGDDSEGVGTVGNPGSAAVDIALIAGPLPPRNESTVEGTVKTCPPVLLAPEGVTSTLPVVALFGTAATIVVELQLVIVATTVLKVTVPELPKLVPKIVTLVPEGPLRGEILLITGPLEPVAENSCGAVPEKPSVVTLIGTLLLIPEGTRA